MGFNILGVALSKKYDDVHALCNTLGIGAVSKENEEAVFEDAGSSYAMDDNAVYITETKTGGTLITFGTGIDFTTIKIRDVSSNGKAMLFVLGDTVGMYVIYYAEDGKILRAINFNEGKKIIDKGNPLAVEAQDRELSEIILALIGEITGTSFWDIEPDNPSTMYIKVS